MENNANTDVYNAKYVQEILFKSIEAYFDKKSIVQHQIDSFNNLINNFQKVFNDIPDIVICPRKDEKYTASFGQVYIDPPIIEENKEDRLLYPAECRLRDLSYEMVVSVDIIERLENTKDHKEISCDTHRKVFMARIPVMIGSDKCNLTKLTLEERKAMGECENDPYGYFIIRGKERVLIPQERMNYNHAYIFDQKNGTKYPYCIEMRSISEETGHSVLIQIKISTDGRNILFYIPYIKEFIPIDVIFKAMGYTDIESFTSLITDDKSDSEKLEIINVIFRKSGIKTKEDALLYIGNRPISPILKDKKISYAKQVIENEIFPHIGISNEKERANLLGIMCSKLIDTYLGRRVEDDRDNITVKRIDTPQTLIGELFRMLLKRLIETIKAKMEKRQDIISLISKTNNITNGIKYSFSTGNWGVQKNNYIRVGVCQVLSRLTYSASISHLRRLNIPIGKEGKNTKIRQLHPTQIFFIDPSESPEGQSIGILKNMAMMVLFSKDSNIIIVKEVIRKCKYIITDDSLEKINSNSNSICTKVFVNGHIVGKTYEPKNLVKEVKEIRGKGLINYDVSVGYDKDDNEIFIYCDVGRLIRPVLKVDEDGNIPIIPYIEKCLKTGKKLDWDEMVDNNFICYIDAHEIETSLIAMYPKDLYEFRDHEEKYDYCEIHPSLMFGVCTSVIPFPDHTQSPRNCYQCSMFKQAIGIYSMSLKTRTDTIGHVLHYPQKSIITTRYKKLLKYDDMPSGINAIVAVMCYTGFNQEDSIILNKAAVERGLFVSSVYKTIVGEEKKKSLNSFESIEVPEYKIRVKSFNYNKLDKDGIIKKGVYVVKGDVIIGKVHNKIFKDEANEKTDKSHVVKAGEEGFIDEIFSSISSEGYRIIKIKIRQTRIPEIGDKFASTNAQKGTTGMILSQEDMPFTHEGISPDIIINSHCLPSRMTIGQLIECVLGKKCLLEGERADSTAFTEESNDPVEEISNKLHTLGYQKHGYETLYNGMTGEPIKARIFIGPTYYQRLKHLVKDKEHSRAFGNVTMLVRQPLDGRSREGGLRLGEMERDALISHGTSAFIRERLFDMSDPYQVVVCSNCGMFSTNLEDCKSCKDNLVRVNIPFASKLLIQELNAMNIKTMFRVK